ncbi:MAG: DUF262 domain-containing protein [Bacillota bacterium]
MNDHTPLKIESQDLTVGALFKDFYSVPDFQREYVWQGEQVERLLQDLFDEFYDEEGHTLTGPEYFLGSIVACKGEDGTFQLIDGQQRMTTLYLILCVIRDMLKESSASPSKVLDSQIADAAIDPRTFREVERFRVTLQYEDSQGVLDKIASGNTPISKIPETTQSVRNVLAAYRAIRDFLNTNLNSGPKRLREFHGVLTTCVKLIRIVTPTIANALKVFETINDRGVGLNAMDLLKNLLFMRTSKKDYPRLKERWKKLVDILDAVGEKPLRFLRYYIMAHHEIDYRRGIREDEIYDWFVKHAAECGIETDPLGFLERLIECAQAHANFQACKDTQGSDNRYLRNLAFLGGALRQQYILLMAARALPQELFDRLCRAIENLLFCYIITRESTKTFERNFARWSADLRAVKDVQGLDAFIAKYFAPDMQNRADRFDFAFRELSQNRIQQYRMRYILAKLTQYIEEQAWGNPAYGRLDHYIAKEVDIEHILPSTPQPDVRVAFDKPEEYDDYVGRLGNLTLLEKTINSSVSNAGFAEKLPGYRQSAFLLTKSLAEKPQVGINTQLNRAVAELIQFNNWDSTAIQRRQEMLAKLARKVWDMPEGKDLSAAAGTEQTGEAVE